MMQLFLILHKRQEERQYKYEPLQKPRLKSQNIPFVYKGWVGFFYTKVIMYVWKSYVNL